MKATITVGLALLFVTSLASVVESPIKMPTKKRGGRHAVMEKSKVYEAVDDRLGFRFNAPVIVHALGWEGRARIEKLHFGRDADLAAAATTKKRRKQKLRQLMMVKKVEKVLRVGG